MIKLALVILLFITSLSLITYGSLSIRYTRFNCIIRYIYVVDCYNSDRYYVKMDAMVNITNNKHDNTHIYCISQVSCDDCIDRYKVGSAHTCFKGLDGVYLGVITRNYSYLIVGITLLLFGVMVGLVIRFTLRIGYEYVDEHPCWCEQLRSFPRVLRLWRHLFT